MTTDDRENRAALMDAYAADVLLSVLLSKPIDEEIDWLTPSPEAWRRWHSHFGIELPD